MRTYLVVLRDRKSQRPEKKPDAYVELKASVMQEAILSAVDFATETLGSKFNVMDYHVQVNGRPQRKRTKK
jgi:hypothetical protein